MSINQYEFDRGYNRAGEKIETLGQYATKVYLWMFFGLMVTFVTAFYMYLSGTVYMVFAVPGVQIVLFVMEIAVVLVLVSRVQKLSVGVARLLFLFYALLNGVVFSTLLFVYDFASVIYVFGLTSLYFGGLSAYGFLTKRDLSGMRPILFSGLIFLLIAGVLSMFLPMGSLDRIVCLIGIAVFLGFTAYDTQKMRSFYLYYSDNPDQLARAGVLFALELYLDYINLFLYLLRFLGNRRD